MNDKLKEILRDTWPNLYRPPHDFKPPAMYQPPQYLIDAARRGDWIDPKDPHVRKIMREAKKEEKQRDLEQEEQKCIDLAIKELEHENTLFEQNEFSNQHTINWNYSKSCISPYCDSTSVRIIERPDTIHYAEYRCNVCYRHNGWLPWSKKNNVPSSTLE